MEQNRDRDPVLDALDQVISTLSEHPTQVEPQTARPQELEPYSTSLEVPRNIHELLDHALVDADMEGGDKYRIEGHPDLLARHYWTLSSDELRGAYQAAYDLGLRPLPVEFVPHMGEVYGIVPLVQGENLETLLKRERSPHIIEVAERILVAIATQMPEALRDGRPWPTDVYTLNQFMWGTIPNDPTPRAWLVDLPLSTYSLQFRDEYGHDLVYNISSLLYAEEAAGAELPAARRAFSEAIMRCPDSQRFGDGLINTAAHCLVNRYNMYRHPGNEEAFIDNFRTY